MASSEDIPAEFPRPRESELSETTENYLKRILWLTSDKEFARISEIADLMGRSLSSTTEAMRRLEEQGFVEYLKNGKIRLTERGYEIASKVNDAYQVISDLLILLGIDSEMAHLDACSMEHAISQNTIETISRFVDYINSDPVNRALLEKFRNSFK